MYSLKQIKKAFSTGVSKTACNLNAHNYIFNYPVYCEARDTIAIEKMSKSNEKSIHDLKEIQKYHKSLAEKHWKLDETHQPHSSFLVRDFKFNSSEETFIFMNLLKEKCNELDHHPEWAVQGDNLTIKLTSHFNKNNVSPKDYELAAFISIHYNHGTGFLFTKRNNQKFISNAMAAIFIFGTFYTMFYMYNLYKNYRITSRDFFFTKIVHSGNDYERTRQLKN